MTNTYTTGTCTRCGGKMRRVGQKVDKARGPVILEAGYEKCSQCGYRKPR
jgi:hypothetical protein